MCVWIFVYVSCVHVYVSLLCNVCSLKMFSEIVFCNIVTLLHLNKHLRAIIIFHEISIHFSNSALITDAKSMM